MSNATLRVEGGVASILVGILLPLGHALNLGGDPATGTILGKTAILIAHTIAVFAFVGFYSKQSADSSTVVGRVGMVLSVIGTILVTAIVFVEIAETTGIDTTPVFTAIGTATVYTVGPLLFVIGILLVGGSIIRGDVLPRWSGRLFVLGTVVFAAAGVSGGFEPSVTVLGAAITEGGFVWAGGNLLRTAGVGDE